MTLKSITIENIKGISNQRFDLGIIPNKPSLLVAPNGFGKSSLAIAFASLKSTGLKLSKECFHQGNDENKPRLTIEIEVDGVIEVLVADESSNTIKKNLDVYVISNRLKPKATQRKMGGFTSSSASLEIEKFVLVDNIPPKSNFEYSLAETKKIFGNNGKILKNIKTILNNSSIAYTLLELEAEIKKLSGARIKKSIMDAIDNINKQTGTIAELMHWAVTNVELSLESIAPLASIADSITGFNEALPSRLDKLLGAYQIYLLYDKDKSKFKSACKYSYYLNEKKSYETIIGSFDTTWKKVKPREIKGKLLVDFPLATDISNGQRDSLCFAAWLQRVIASPTNRDSIIIIDEVFDYLDDANLVAAQYYISNLIKAKKEAARRVYPLILTHLNPLYFNNFTFKDQKVYFLKKYQPVINPNFKKLIVNRKALSIAQQVDKYYFHFSPSFVNIKNEFIELGLKETWGESTVFHTHLDNEWKKYLESKNDYDPFAICCYVRVKIEEKIYSRITDPVEQHKFITTNGTRKKLDQAELSGIPVDDTMFLLGVIYNEGMHIKDNVDNSSPIVAKLENLVIRKMLIDCING
ncbi:ATP-binding protein [Yersinia intermedia]|uniref:ATP-binding protein n=1 Tax=Yersinia intermedia TaxID=631 RepID=UPI001F53B092|nr:ATP-binding protein [Yersinia intermedia]UNK21780.1 ATP-binding protein [Yersinia intermedia]